MLRYLFPFPIIPWPPAVWTRKDVADVVTLIATLVTTVAAFVSTQLDTNHKSIPIVIGCVCGVIALYGKAASSQLEKREKEKKELDTRARAAKIAESLLEAMHRGHFRTEGEEDAHKNRVTVFICVEPNGSTVEKKHLAIFARCGVHRKSTTTWIIDDEHPDGCRGAAGKAWYHEVVVTKHADCDWPGDDGPITDKEMYSNSQGITVTEAEALKVKSRAVVAAPVMVRGRKWGVLVLDSVSGEAIPDVKSPNRKEFKAMFNHYAELVGKALGEAGV